MPNSPGNRWKKRWQTRLLSLLLMLCLPCWTSQANEQDERRVLIGLKLFPAVLAADQGIEGKTGHDGRLLLLLVYRDNKITATQLSKRLDELKEGIRGLPLAPVAITHSSLGEYRNHTVAGIFLAERLPEQLDTLIDFAKAHQAILFSPFQEDVEKGAASGLYVSDRILPYVNLPALRGANVRLKPFFLEVAKHHD